MANFFQKTKSSTKNLAQQAAKKAAHEKGEFVKSVKKQTMGNSDKTPSLIEEVITDGKAEEPSPSEEEIKKSTNKRLEELEKELEKLRAKRKAEYEEWKKNQEVEMGTNKGSLPKPEPLVEPTTKPKRGILSQVKKKQGTREMGKVRSG